jgi:predicted CopG family antitoxin
MKTKTQMSITLDDGIYEKLKEIAKFQKKSISSVINDMIGNTLHKIGQSADKNLKKQRRGK